MERIISQEERIKRAEEIYNRRRYENRNNYYTRNKNRYDEESAKSVKAKIAKKMIIQMLICVIIYTVIFLIQNSEQLFSKNIIDRAKEILAYDISIENLTSYWNNAQNGINGLFNKGEFDSENSQETTNQNDTNSEENSNQDEVENTENSDQQQEEIINQDITSEEPIEEQIIAVGGAEEIAQIEEKTQEQLDIDYVKQNINIIWPLTGTITSRFGTRTPTEIVTANHYGIDIAGNIGDAIVSAIDGIVTQYSTEGDYGYHLRVENGEITTLYAHCSKLCVEEGTTVKQGEKIAEVGQTGRATRTTFAL